ncbi:MAG: hypothetical protein ACJ74V_17205, partial [Gaiellaceae bacterium]
GYLSIGFTENPFDFAGELLAVRTDSAGLAGGCSQRHPATPLDAVDPQLVGVTTLFPVRATLPTQADLPGKVQRTSIGARGGPC